MAIGFSPPWESNSAGSAAGRRQRENAAGVSANEVRRGNDPFAERGSWCNAKGPTTLTQYRPKFTDIWKNVGPYEGDWDEKPRTLYAVAPGSGRTLWEADYTIAAADPRGRLRGGSTPSTAARSCALDRTNGKGLWQSDAVPAAKRLALAYGPTLWWPAMWSCCRPSRR